MKSSQITCGANQRSVDYLKSQENHKFLTESILNLSTGLNNLRVETKRAKSPLHNQNQLFDSVTCLRNIASTFSTLEMSQSEVEKFFMVAV